MALRPAALMFALASGTALLLWIGLRSRAEPEPEPSPAPASAGVVALGVVAADHDPARAILPELDATPPADVPAQQRPAASPPAAATQPESAEPPAAPIATSPEQAAAAAASVAEQPKIVAALRADFDARRDALRRSCFPRGSDVGATFTVEASYAPDGTMLSLGVSDVPGLPRVSTCLMEQIIQKPPALRELPAVPVTVAVPIEFAGARLPEPPAGPDPSDDGRAESPVAPRG
ncbi:hypothetical protein [Nannocystis radixulma]|uniref:AgmX/PglI C-terminal domain-containing protein n=1 Tax=Nannocystis radixulma TaxID=2995305 RepID=A0ABT5AX42_9BACT|nr:hypothetical protein [Nannocystis radixulma]MDC0666386.1 hypothetical protein [Nannocystis radixulma]